MIKAFYEKKVYIFDASRITYTKGITMHSIALEDRKTFTATEVKEVASFSDKEVKIVTKNDEKITIIGDNLVINGFSKQQGTFSLTGNIRQIRYSGASESFLRRIFR